MCCGCFCKSRELSVFCLQYIHCISGSQIGVLGSVAVHEAKQMCPVIFVTVVEISLLYLLISFIP